MQASNLYHAQKQPLDEAWCYYRLALVLLKLKYADSSELTAVELPIDYLTEVSLLVLGFPNSASDTSLSSSRLATSSEKLESEKPRDRV